jgi:hypothetical protein
MKHIYTYLLAGLTALSLISCGQTKVSVEDAAKEASNQISYTDQASAGVSGDFALVTSSSSSGYDFTVTYTAGAKIEYPAGYTFISISEDGATAKVTPPNYLDATLNFKATYGTFAQCYIKSTLHLDGKDYEGTQYNIKVNAISQCAIADLYGASLFVKGVAVETYGYYTGTYNPDDPYNGVFVSDGDAGVQLYGLSKLPSGIKEGDLVKVSGKTSPYSGVAELAAPLSMTIVDKAPFAVTSAKTIEFTESTVLVQKNISNKLHAQGTLSDVKMLDSGGKATTDIASAYKVTGNINVGTAKLYIYCYSKYMTPENFTASATKMSAGGTVDMTAYLSIYSSDNSFSVSKCQVIDPIFA